MKGNATRRKDAEDRSLNRSDLAILSAVARLHYLTAAQVSRLVFPGCHDEDRYARRRLARLVDAGLLLRLKPLALPHRGAAPHVFTLAHAGRQLLGLPTGSPCARVRSSPRPATCSSSSTPWPPSTW